MSNPSSRLTVLLSIVATTAALLMLSLHARAAGANSAETSHTQPINRPITPMILSTVLTPTALAQTLVGQGVTISNVAYTGTERSAGTFIDDENVFGFPEGVVLATGEITNIVGPNNNDSFGDFLLTAGDPDLEQLAGEPTFDATILTFDFVPDSNHVFFQFVFGSEEYDEYVNTEFNDVFAFYVNGVNCATVDGDPIAVNTINNGRFDSGVDVSNPDLYVNNTIFIPVGDRVNSGVDGFTTVLTCASEVLPFETNQMKLAIADASDRRRDSYVFIQQGSFTTEPGISLSAENDCHVVNTTPAAITASVIAPNGQPLTNTAVTFEVTDGPNSGITETLVTDNLGQAMQTYTSTLLGTDLVRVTYLNDHGIIIPSQTLAVQWANSCVALAVSLSNSDITSKQFPVVLLLTLLLTSCLVLRRLTDVYCRKGG